MKTKIIMRVIASLVVIFGTTGCYKDVLDPGGDPTAPPAYVSFSGDLIPIFNENCNSAGCHDGAAHAPDLRPDKAYVALTGGGYVNTIVPATSTIYVEVASGSMPPTGALPKQSSKLILDWIRNGAPNN